MAFKDTVRRTFVVVGALLLGGVWYTKHKEYVEDHNAKAELLAKQDAQKMNSIMKNGKNMRVAEFAEHGAISGIYGERTNIDTLRHSGDMRDETAPKTGALAGINRVGDMMRDTLIDGKTVVKTTNERTGELETRRLYESKDIVDVDSGALEFRTEKGQVKLGKVVMDENTAVQMSGTDIIIYMSDTGLKMSGSDIDRVNVVPTKNGGVLITPVDTQEAVAQKAAAGAEKSAAVTKGTTVKGQTTTAQTKGTTVTGKKAVKTVKGKTGGKRGVKDTLSSHSGRHINEARLVSNRPSEPRIFRGGPKTTVVDMSADAPTTTVTVQFGEKTKTVSNRPIVNRNDFGR